MSHFAAQFSIPSQMSNPINISIDGMNNGSANEMLEKLIESKEEFDRAIKEIMRMLQNTNINAMENMPSKQISMPSSPESTSPPSFSTISVHGHNLSSHYDDDSRKWIMLYEEERIKNERLESSLKREKRENAFLRKRLEEEMERSIRQSISIEELSEQLLANPGPISSRRKARSPPPIVSSSTNTSSGSISRKKSKKPEGSLKRKEASDISESTKNISRRSVSTGILPLSIQLEPITNNDESPFSLLPDELVVVIFSYFHSAHHLTSVSRVCTRFRRLSEDDLLWKNLYLEKWERDLTLSHSPLSPSSPSNSLTITPTLSPSSLSLSPALSYKQMYMHKSVELNRTNRNWMKGKCRIMVLHGHNSIVHCLQYQNNTVVSGAGYGDNTVKIWDVTTGLCMGTLEGHTDSIHCVRYDDTKVVSGSSDIKVWDRSSLNCISTISGHTDVVLCAQLPSKSTILTGSSDKTIKLWDERTGDCVHTLIGHRNWVTCLELLSDNWRVVSGSYDNTLRFWDLRTVTAYDTATVLPAKRKKDVKGVACLMTSDDTIVTGSGDGRVRIWKQHKGEWMTSRVLEGHLGAVWCLSFSGSRVISGSADKTIKIWNADTGQCTYSLRGHDGGVYCCSHDEKRIVSGSFDKKIYVWDFEA